MVIQKEKQQVTKPSVKPEYHRGMPYGYFRFGDLILYSWLWSELSFDHNIHMSDVDLFTDDGEFISSVGAEGIDASDASIMDYNEDFDARMDDLGSSDVDIDGMDTGGMEDMVDTESSKGWFDGMFEDGGDFDMDFDF